MKTIIRLYLLISLILSIVASTSEVFPRVLIEHRAPFVVVEVVTGEAVAIREDGKLDGVNMRGDYIAYADVEVGTQVSSVFLWNPFNNYCDDMMARWDIMTWKP